MTAKADLLRALDNNDRREDAMEAEVLTVAKRLKMSAKAIIRAGSDIGAAPRRTPERPLTVEEAVMFLVQHCVSAARSARSGLAGNEGNEEDQSIQQDECEGVEGTVSTNATRDQTHKNGPGENLTDGNPSLEEASNKELFSVVCRPVSMLDEERIASKDTETGLNQKVNSSPVTHQAVDRPRHTQAQAREEKLTRRANNVKACIMSAFANTPTRTKAHSPTLHHSPTTLTECVR